MKSCLKQKHISKYQTDQQFVSNCSQTAGTTYIKFVHSIYLELQLNGNSCKEAYYDVIGALKFRSKMSQFQHEQFLSVFVEDKISSAVHASVVTSSSNLLRVS